MKKQQNLLFFTKVILITLVFSKEAEKCNFPNKDKKGECGCSKLSRNALGSICNEPTIESVDKPSMKYLQETNEPTIESIDKPSVKYLQESNVNENMKRNKKTKSRTNQMVFVTGGEFTMGTDRPYLPRDGEAPARKVRVKSFYADVYEVSNAEFALFVESTGHVTEVDWSILGYCNLSFFKSIFYKFTQWQ